jgi:methyl-accepting chemotaxis protein
MDQCDFHQQKLDRLDESFQQIALLTARVEEHLTHIDGKLEEMSASFSSASQRLEVLALKAQEVDLKVLAFEKSRKEKKEKLETWFKAGLGVLSGILLTLTLTLLGLK